MDKRETDEVQTHTSPTALQGGHERSLGAFVTKEVDSTLTFPESNAAKMEMLHIVDLQVTTEMRFLERSYTWTGRGVQMPPAIRVTIGAEELAAKQHGPVYRDDFRTSYLIDLGKRIPPGELVRVQTLSSFVDEAGSFKPFFSFTSAPILDRLRLRVRFRTPPRECEYSQCEDVQDARGWRQGEYVAPEVLDDFHVFEAPIGETPRGGHRLTWAFTSYGKDS